LHGLLLHGHQLRRGRLLRGCWPDWHELPVGPHDNDDTGLLCWGWLHGHHREAAHHGLSCRQHDAARWWLHELCWREHLLLWWLRWLQDWLLLCWGRLGLLDTLLLLWVSLLQDRDRCWGLLPCAARGHAGLQARQHIWCQVAVPQLDQLTEGSTLGRQRAVPDPPEHLQATSSSWVCCPPINTTGHD
jgi:hypothetical protein